MMVAESGGAVTREVYCKMHLRISKALSTEEDFGVEESMRIANADWGVGAQRNLNPAALLFSR